MNASTRRWRFVSLTGILILAVTASIVLANVLAQRLAPRVDVTAAGEHRLSPRSIKLLESLEPGYRIVVAARASADTRRSRERLEDVLDQFVRHAGRDRLSYSLLDTGAADGQARFEELLHGLANRERSTITKHADEINQAVSVTQKTSAALERLGNDLTDLRDAFKGESKRDEATRQTLDAGASQCHANAKTLATTAESMGKELTSQQGSTIVPNTPPIAQNLRASLADAATFIEGVQEGVAKLGGNAEAPAPARSQATAIAASLNAPRDLARRSVDALDRLPSLDLLRVESVLRAGSAALVIAPLGSGLNAIPIERLLPSDMVQGDQRRDAEELLTIALSALAEPNKPIIVFMHAERGAGLIKAVFSELTDRLSHRGIDWVEWATFVEPDAPNLTRLDPKGVRPVVYAVISTNSASGSAGASGADRAQRLGRVVEKLVAEGKPLLVSLFPFSLASFNQADPLATALSPLGVKIDTARPVLHERATTSGRFVEAFARVTAKQPALDEHNPVLRAIENLPTFFEWPIALTPDPQRASGIRFTPLYEINDKSSWAESEWMAYAQLGLDQHRPGSPDAPANDSPRDQGQGPWTIAAAVERTDARFAKPQRAVFVGSNRWAINDVLNGSTIVDQRLVPSNPGNSELFESSVLWLAGQDTLIAQSVSARSIALIAPLSPSTLSMFRWGLMAGLPALILGAGVAWRTWRG